MLKQMGVEMMEYIVVNELCEFHGRKKLADSNITVTPVVSTELDVG